MRRSARFLTTAAAAAGLALAAASAANAASVVYDAIPAPAPGNVASLGYEATSSAEWGGAITLAGTARAQAKVTVLMSSWGCESGGWTTNDCVTTPGATFSHPITLNVYTRNPDNSVGSLVATQTKTFAIPYRPSADPACTDGRWSPDGGTSCFNGLATPITFDALGATLPDSVIVTVAYNTTHHGYAPIGESAACFTESGGCGYDSLNVGAEGVATVGTQPLPDDTYWNTTYGPFYCDGGAGGTGTLRLDAGCWTGFQPNLRVSATDAYTFTGFFQPVDNGGVFNQVQAGRAIPVKFRLGGDFGLDVFADGYPKSQTIACNSTAPVDGIEETTTAGQSSLSYDAGTGTYTYVWKTDKAWASTCRQLVVKFNDGTTAARANFSFRK